MNIIETNITDLLHEYECVIVPGFGGFVTNYRPAYIDTVEDTFVPPTRDLDFLDALTFDDGILTQEIAVQNGHTRQQARHSIENYTQNCIVRLGQYHEISVPKIGKINLDGSQNLQFQPEKTNFLTDSFGLPQLELHLIDRNPPPPPASITPTPRTPILRQKPGIMAKKSTFSLFNILVLATIAFAGYYVWERYKISQYKITKTRTETRTLPRHTDAYEDGNTTQLQVGTTDRTVNIEEENQPIVPQTNTAPPPVEATPEPQVPAQVTTTTVVPKAKPIAPKPRPQKPATTVSSGKRHRIVVGAFGSAINADRMIEKCEKYGYKTETSWSNSMKRVAVVVTCANSQVTSELRKVQSRINPQAWVMK